MSKVILIKTGKTCEDADIAIMIEVNLMNQLVNTQKLLRDKGFLTEAAEVDKMIGKVRLAYLGKFAATVFKEEVSEVV